MLINSMRIKGLLSFKDMSLDMRPLNILIGPNASGKSNLIEMVALLQATPRNLADFIRGGDGITEWLWKGVDNIGGVAIRGSIDVTLNVPSESRLLRYTLEIGRRGNYFDITKESLEYERPDAGHFEPYRYFHVQEGRGMIRVHLEDDPSAVRTRSIGEDTLTPAQSVLREVRDPVLNPEITRVSRQFDATRLFREWNMGRKSRIRNPQQTDAPNDFLEEDFSNLALVFNQLQGGPTIREIEENLRQFYDMYEQVGVGIDSNRTQIWVRERGLSSVIPATRLSDGTLRFFALLVILCHPKPPPLICIEEPELGLHPNIIPQIAKLLKSASGRTQLIVTTHSKALVDEFSDDPESIVVCERNFDSSTEFSRLSADRLQKWLERYQLGELWEKGEIGGTRW